RKLIGLLALGLSGIACRSATEPASGPGSIVWSFPAGSGTAPAVADSTVYFGTYDNTALALDSRTGTLRWRTSTGETGGSPGRNVLLVGPLLIVPDFGVYAFDRATGQKRWSFRPASGDSPGRYAIATDGTRIFLGSAAGFAYALDAATGSVLWTNAYAVDGNSTMSYPMTDRGQVYLTLRHFTNPSTGGVVALDALTGALRWERDFPSTAPGRGTGSYGRVGIWHDLVIAASDDGTVYALNRADGTIAWISPRPADEAGLNDQRPIVVIGDIAVVGSDRSVLTGLDAASGQQRWLFRNRFGSVNDDIGSDGQSAYVTDASLVLTKVDAATGTMQWSNPTGAPSTGPGFVGFPTADAERVYAPGFSKVFALLR
ncbi:MAG: PQQ-binding-like beta-propeller repeat protein, partial [Gemmatimonadaceae bacterium]|nr:PQQ-binding-like beta-propeller repeat protein [Gemmatimonadaceae bacterium]